MVKLPETVTILSDRDRAQAALDGIGRGHTLHDDGSRYYYAVNSASVPSSVDIFYFNPSTEKFEFSHSTAEFQY